MRAVLNWEGYFALAWVLLLARSATREEPAAAGGRGWRWALLLTPIPFLPFLLFPFLADDYPHILHARALTWAGVPPLFTVAAADHFFRPMGYLSFALDAQWAGYAPLSWRLSGLAIHAANTGLVYVLCRTLRIGGIPAVFGALLFGIHGSRPEAVIWVAARFDLLAVLFGLTSLILLLRGRTLGAVLALLAATLSKESAFIVPLLGAAVLWHQRTPRREAIRRGAPLFLVAGLVFVYRWILLGGVGGYRDAADGMPTVFHFKLTSSLQALFPRFWGTLLFPLNWTSAPDGLLLLLLLLGIASLLWFAIAGGAVRRQLVLGLAFAYLCALPVHQFLSIGADLEKSRVLYFASVGLAIVFASCITTRRLMVPAMYVLIFQCAALEHNLEIWKRVGYRAKAACVAGARDLPNVVDGVYFLHTGYPECLEFK